MMKETKKVPVLRFPEFDGEWGVSKLGDNFKIIDGDRGVNYPNSSDFFDNEYCLFLNAKNVTKSGFSFSEKHFITKEKDEILRKGKLELDDIVLTTRGSVGHFAHYNSNVNFQQMRINSGMVLLRNVNGHVNTEFIYKLSDSPKLRKQISIIAFGSAQPQLTVKEISKFKLAIPTLPEQQKIASFLTAQDDYIASLEKEEQLLQAYKKGIMQRIFASKGDPKRLRFKIENGASASSAPNDTASSAPNESTNSAPALHELVDSKGGELVEPPEWEEKKLGEVCSKVGSGKTPKGGDKVYSTEGIVFIRSQNIIDNKLQIDETKIPESIHYEMKNSIVLGLDILLNITGASIGRSCVVPEEFNEGNVNQHVCIIRLSEGEPYFIQSFISSQKGQKLIFQGQTGSGREGLNFESIKRFKVPFPCLEEQQKIATFLAKIDEQIDGVKTQIEQAKSYKKGLLQKMFV